MTAHFMLLGLFIKRNVYQCAMIIFGRELFMHILEIHSFINGFTALCLALTSSSLGLLGRGSALRKAATYIQNNTNTE
jgi:hypothetical protein